MYYTSHREHRACASPCGRLCKPWKCANREIIRFSRIFINLQCLHWHRIEHTLGSTSNLHSNLIGVSSIGVFVSYVAKQQRQRLMRVIVFKKLYHQTILIYTLIYPIWPVSSLYAVPKAACISNLYVNIYLYILKNPKFILRFIVFFLS